MNMPKQTEVITKERQAVAPYNFVPLPDAILEAQTPPSQGVFHPDLLTGWFDLEIETCTPTYIRGMYTTQQYQEFGEKKAAELSPDQKMARAPFYAIQNVPAIPGSSLRGMLRELVEVVGNGRMRWVSKSPTFTFRAMADKSDDPLKDRYKKIFGNMASNVRAGYLVFEDGEWYVQPAQTIKQAGVGKSKDYFLKIYEDDIDVDGYIRMDQPDYRPQVLNVAFQENGRVPKRTELIDAARRKNKKISDPQKHIQEDRPCYTINESNTPLKYAGVLVTTGNMRETGAGALVRYKHYIFMPPDEKAAKLRIPEQVVDDYRSGLTPYQEETLGDWRDGIHDSSWGCLGHGKPVFYILSEKKDEILFFGHNLNFRIPAMHADKKRAVTPLDFVPEHLRYNTVPDMADAIFGWVEEWDEETDAKDNFVKKQVGPSGQYAGRVFFADAMYQSSTKGLWLKPNQEPITPKILSSPKPTTFQHYLVQDKQQGHNPDDKISLANYTTRPNETGIRGHKFYWHKGLPSLADLEHQPEDAQKKQNEKVLTRITPVKEGVRFVTRVRFENLRPEELGLLCWTILLPGETGKTYRHKIGMGKPLGMGSLRLNLTSLTISNRNGATKETHGRYAKLVEGETWFDPASSALKPEDYAERFEDFLREKDLLAEGQKLAHTPRIKELLELLTWRGERVPDQVREVTRYLEIEHSQHGNEYKERPVLPTPAKVFDGWFKGVMDMAKEVDILKEQAKRKSELKTLKDPGDLKPGDKLRDCLVERIDSSNQVHLTHPDYGETVDIVINAPEKKYHKNKTVSLLLFFKMEPDEDYPGSWIVYCKEP